MESTLYDSFYSQTTKGTLIGIGEDIELAETIIIIIYIALKIFISSLALA
jgi:hypothetical protein